MITQGICKYVVARGSNRGEQCGHSCRGEYCTKHKPEQMKKQKEYLKVHCPYTTKNDNLRSLEAQVATQKENIQMLCEEADSMRLQMRKLIEDSKAKFNQIENECTMLHKSNEDLRKEQK